MPGSEPAKTVRPKNGDERQLIEAAQRNRVHFAAIYERYFELVYAYVARRIRNRNEIEDLVSDVFRKALASLPRFKWTGAPFAAWLLRIASNLLADRAKQAAREGNVVDAEASESLPAKLGKEGQQLELEECERRARLYELIDELADDQRRVVVMRFAEEKSIKEISDELERSEGAVKQLQFRALQNLRAKLGNL
jgi:RNA polymerase sigma-70 factor (ECF subfamily)